MSSKYTNKQPDLQSLKPLDLNVLIVGGTGGLGRAISRYLGSLGSKITVIGQTFRDEDLASAISFIKADLTSLVESKSVAKNLNADIVDFDLIIFTTGIFASRTKETTNEGLEKDMAVSYLNRLVMLKEFLPAIESKLDSKPANKFGFKSRIVVFGYPGNGELGTIDDLNQDKSYSFLKAHMNTVAGNEALVNYVKAKHPGIQVVGVNPGLVKTGIRKNLTGSGWFSGILESAIGFFNPTPEQFAVNLTPSLLSEELSNFNGVFLNAKGFEKKSSEGMDQEYSLKFIQASEELIKSKLGESF